LQELSTWMPVGILAILAATALRSTIAAAPHAAPFAAIAIAVTAGVHLAFGRWTILCVGIGTTVYVILINLA